MVQDDQLGLRAWLTPYNGYLHLLPRLIAWIASHTADVAWWPAIYNGLAFALSVGVFARMASPRVALPAKPWLMLSLVLVVGTGEVLINVTNLQWITAFFLILHLFTVPATTHMQRVADIVLLLVVGLNGPFALLLLPWFAVRAWRDRNLDTTLALGAITLCAAITAWLLLRQRGGLSLDDSDAPFRPLMFLSVIGSRLVTWPFVGSTAVRDWPLWTHAVIGLVTFGALLGLSLRSDARRAARVTVVTLLCVITLACAYRVRADTWADDNLVNGDRYFYIPRVLLTWLLIWEFDAHSRALAWTARGLCLLALALHVPRFILPAPKNYRWAEHCDPIRRGEPAQIPTLPEGWLMTYPGRRAER